ncbi:MAG: hydroxyacid dehydrogenase [Acidobacteria bacterium]|nr:MAG: hydroxyacid dehydrogenase [Acidobacteriota bacterium]
MKVLVADRFEQSGLDGLRRGGCDVVYQPELTGDALRDAIVATEAEVLVVRGTDVRGAIFRAGSLALIVRAGAGYNTIDVEEASRRGIYVANCPGKNAVAVSELAFGLMLALDRRLPDNVSDLRVGQWNKTEYSKARGLFGRTLGLLGYGHIGQEMAARARAFGMPVVVWSRRFSNNAAPDPASIGVEIVRRPQEVAERCDVLSVHLALTPETRGLVDGSVLGRMKAGSYFINTARTELVDQAALERAVLDLQLRVGLDVFPSEPAEGSGLFRPPLLSLPNVYGTHHIGASTVQAQEAIADEAVRIVTTYKNTGHVPNVVNLAQTTPATARLVVRHVDRPGVLAHILDLLRAADINVQEMDNIIFKGANAAVAHINLDRAPSDTLLEEIKSGDRHILAAHLVTL